MRRLEAFAPLGASHHGTLTLSFELRSKSRLRARLDDGEEVAVSVPRGRVLRNGDLLCGSDGLVVRVQAADEEVSTARAADPEHLARVAYHLGNRHVALQVGPGWVRYLHDHVLDDMVRSLRAEVRLERAPFEPEGGAYDALAHHHHGGDHHPEHAVSDHGNRHHSTAVGESERTPGPGSVPHRLAQLRLASQALPVGGFSHSRGLEGAVAAGWVHDEETASLWILGVLEHAICPLDGAVLWRLHRGWRADDQVAIRRWTLFLRASRESAELALEDEQMGRALARLLTGCAAAARTHEDLPVSFVCEFARAAAQWGLSGEDALLAFFWSAIESQVGAALRLLPLGQTAGQRILERAAPAIERAMVRVPEIADDDVGGFTPGLALASAWHETQYSRLFRS